MSSLTKTSTHPIKLPNRRGARSGKLSRLSAFITDYAAAVRFFVRYLWDNRIIYGDDNRVFSIKDDLLDCPQFLSTTAIDFQSELSARALKCAITQACGIIRSAVSKRKTLLFVRSKMQEKGERTRNITTAIRRTPCLFPNLANISPELNSICANFIPSTDGSFDGFLVLSSLGKKYGGKISLPISFNKHSRRLAALGGILMKSFLLSPNNAYLRWSIPLPEKKTEGSVEGGDTGINSVVSISDGQQTKPNQHGRTLNEILKKIARCEKGSKAFWRALDERDNFICWSVKQIDFSDIKELRLEKISNFRSGKKVSKFLNYFGEPLIREKLIEAAMLSGVQIKEQPSPYRSQRCSRCGFVCKKNRSGKRFSCKHCSFQADADYNASCNHKAQLPDIVPFLQRYGKQKEPFFWKESGFFSIDGAELTVPHKQSEEVK